MAQGNRTEFVPNLATNGNLGKSEHYNSVNVLGKTQYSTIQKNKSSQVRHLAVGT